MATTTGPSYITPESSVPRIAVPSPHSRKPSLSIALASEDSVRNSTAEEIPVPSIPNQYQKSSLQRELSSSDLPPPPARSTSAAPKYVPKTPPRQNSSLSQNKSNDSGYHSSSSGAGVPKSPVVPIRSMFPVYNPNVSLSQQNYFPQRPAMAGLQSPQHDFPSSSMTPIDRALGPKSVPPSIANFPLDPLSPRVSSTRDLMELWEATHGMEPNPKIKSYDLELTRTEEANFTLGCDPSAPFYSLITYDTNEVALSKANPKKPSVKCEVSVNSIESAARRGPPNDGLVTFIFPKMAAMLAINQSTALAKEHGLAPTHRDEIQAAAVKRAADQEACRLKWNATHQHYELEHPAVGRRLRDPNFARSPQSALSPPTLSIRSALDIFVTSPIGRTLPTITIADPRTDLLDSPSEPSVHGIRMSTIPQSDNDNALLVLDFNTRIMHINANKILENVPSLFAIDSLVSATMTVAIADEKTNAIMAAMELWQSTRSPIPRAMSTYAPSVAGKSTTGSVFYATLAEREEAEAEARELAQIHERDIKNKERRKAHRGWFGRSKASKAPKSKTKTVTVKEFDLEKLGKYQSGERKGQELPGVVRAILAVMVGGLKFVVWILTTIVQFLTWFLVLATRGVTSEKF